MLSDWEGYYWANIWQAWRWRSITDLDTIRYSTSKSMQDSRSASEESRLVVSGESSVKQHPPHIWIWMMSEDTLGAYTFILSWWVAFSYRLEHLEGRHNVAHRDVQVERPNGRRPAERFAVITAFRNYNTSTSSYCHPFDHNDHISSPYIYNGIASHNHVGVYLRFLCVVAHQSWS